MDENGANEKGRKEWNASSTHERNCLMWPDFLVWGQARDVEVHRKDSGDSPIGLVTVAVQDKEKNLWYNVAKKITENHPAYGLVKPCEWICEVDGTPTTDCSNEKFSSLIRNGKEVVCLSLKEPVDSLAEFVKKWDEEKIVTFKLSQETDFQKRYRFVHFYSQDDSGKEKDHILVWEAKRGTETHELILHRGEELLEVNGQAVEGKKLAEIYKLILDQAPADDVKLKIKAILPKMSGVEETAENTDSPDSSLGEDKPNVVFDDAKQCLVAEKEMDRNAGHTASEILVNNPGFKNSTEIMAQPQIEPDSSEIQKSPPENKKKPRLPSLSRRLPRRSSSSSKSQCEGEASGSVSPSSAENEAYTSTPPPQRKPPLCGKCAKKDKSQLPEDRDNWPIHRIEIGCLEEIRNLLDLDRSTVPVMSALGCFTSDEADLIKQEFMPSGCGIAKKALDKWATSNKENNVGALKKILKETMKRMDVVHVIEDWKKLRVCHGCGIKM